MKVFIQLIPLLNGKRVEGRKAWVGKDGAKLTIESIYTTKDTASMLNKLDLIEIAELESKGVLKVLDVYRR